MKGPNPVCTLAMENTNQSSPRRLAREGAGGRAMVAGSIGFCMRAPASPGSGRSCGTAIMMRSERSLLLGGILCGTSRDWLRKFRTEHHDRGALLIFGREPQAVAAQIHAD